MYQTELVISSPVCGCKYWRYFVNNCILRFFGCWDPIQYPTRCPIIRSHEISKHTRSHYGDVIMSAIASQITSLTIVYSTVYSDADQRKHQSSASLAFVWGIHRGPVNSPHKWPVLRGKCFHLMTSLWLDIFSSPWLQRHPGESSCLIFKAAWMFQHV